uniref:Oxygen sensor histidine kinase NreB n=1 Tax=Roseihalotalea indica TaxID=2867963 RepID=A0AA49JBH0_9BACT|nr:PAS domain S-box protein [Tunicatimonas sp. TK19036]
MNHFTANQKVLRALVEASVMGILVVDTDGKIAMVNPYGQDLFGYGDKELIGQSLEVLIPASLRNAHVQMRQSFFADPKARPMGIGRKLRGVRKNGEQFPVEVSLGHMQVDQQHYAIAFIVDVTAQQLVKDQNTLLSKIFHESLNGIYVFDATTLQITQANTGAFEQTGYSPEALSHLHPWDLTSEETEESFRQRIAPLQTLRNQKISYETTFVRKDQRSFPAEVHLQRFVYNSGEVYMQIVIDISERRQAEEALTLQSEITKNLAEGVLLLKAKDATIVYSNAQLDHMFGYQNSELYGQHVSVLSAPAEENRKSVFLDIVHALQKTGAWSGEVCNQRKNGTTFWCLVSASAFEHPTYGRVWVAALTDVDQRKKAEEALEKEKKKFQMYLDVAAALFIVVEKDYTVSLINQRGCDILGYSEEEVIGQHWFDLFIPASERENVLSVFNRAMQDQIENIEYFENKVKTRTRGERLIEWHNTIIRDAAGKPVATLSSGVDITEKRKAEQAMTHALIEGQELERKRIAKELHDGLGQSLTAIRLHLNALESDVAQFTQKNKDSFDKLKLILQTTTQEVKSISRDLMPNILQDYGLVKALEFLCQTINDTNTVQVHLQVYNMERTLDQSSTIGLYRVSQELINNALKHAQATRIDIQLVGHNSSIVLSVEDDGIGFDHEKNNSSPSRGYGLTNIETRVKSLSGTFNVETRSGEGTLVIVEIPLNQSLHARH